MDEVMHLAKVENMFRNKVQVRDDCSGLDASPVSHVIGLQWATVDPRGGASESGA